MAEPETDAERERALARALVELKAATATRRRLPPGSSEILSAVRQEREAMERVERLVELLERDRN
jgi:hypothetical protein